MEYQWYPGHMTRALRQMKEDLSLIDIVIEVCDARIPFSSRNPDIDTLAKGKGRILIFAKADLADAHSTERWMARFEEQGIAAVAADARTSGYLREVSAAIDAVSAEKRERDRKRGIKNRPVRAMVVGIPNSGKSTFINSFSRKASAKTGNKPGVTKGKQWIHMEKGVDLLDTPGILTPKFESQQVGLHLAICGSINDNILNIDELAAEFLGLLEGSAKNAVMERYGLHDGEDAEKLQEIAQNRHLLKSGGEPDLSKAARLLIDDFRKGAIGRITLEEP